MTEKDSIPPAGLHPRLVKRLLDNLESDEGFRKQFQESPEQALRSIGYTDPWACMQVKGGQLASPSRIRAQREKLESSLALPHTQLCDFSDQEGS